MVDATSLRDQALGEHAAQTAPAPAIAPGPVPQPRALAWRADPAQRSRRSAVGLRFFRPGRLGGLRACRALRRTVLGGLRLLGPFAILALRIPGTVGTSST
jgi:hypothetical protein